MAKITARDGYTFNPSVGTLDLSGVPNYATAPKPTLLAIYNQTEDGKGIYQLATTGLSGTFSGSVLTFETNVSAMLSTDKLVIFFDDGSSQLAAVGTPSDAAASGDTGTFSIVSLLKRGLARWTTLLAALPASLGQKAMAASLPVVLPSDQTVAVDTVVRATATDRSGAITTGGTAQQLMAANTSRRGFEVQNLSSGDLWISGLTTAILSQPSMRIRSGGWYETPPHRSGTGAISIIGATTGQAFYAREF